MLMLTKRKTTVYSFQKKNAFGKEKDNYDDLE